MTAPNPYWWESDKIRYDERGCLLFDGREVVAEAAALGTPAYLYSSYLLDRNLARLREVIPETGCAVRVLYAMKANRFPPVLHHFRKQGLGLDICSPNEVRHALSCGYSEVDLSFTAGALSTADYQALAQWPAMEVNLDSLTAIRRLAEVSPRRRIGLRINPSTGVSYSDNPMVRYAQPASEYEHDQRVSW